MKSSHAIIAAPTVPPQQMAAHQNEATSIQSLGSAPESVLGKSSMGTEFLLLKMRARPAAQKGQA